MIGRDARGYTQRGHCREPRERDERAAAIVCGANQAHEIHIAKKRSINAAFACEHYQTESARAKQFVDSTKCVHPALRAHEKRPLFPKRAGDRSGDVYPGRAITMRDCGTACRAHDGSRAAARFPDGESAERKAAAGECAIELSDPRENRIGDVLRDLDSVRKTLFEQNTECGDLGRHGMKMIPNKHRSCKVQAIMHSLGDP